MTTYLSRLKAEIAAMTDYEMDAYLEMGSEQTVKGIERDLDTNLENEWQHKVDQLRNS